MKNKKSAGVDGVGQDIFVMGASFMAQSLTILINKSITTGEFPQIWKEALVTPVLKKGDPTQLGNYRPVSCLPAVSKILERIVCDQTTDYIEKNIKSI